MKAFLVTFVLVALARINVVSACNGCSIKYHNVTTIEGKEHMKLYAPKVEITKDCDLVTSKKSVVEFKECLKFKSIHGICKYKDMGDYKVNVVNCTDYNEKVKNHKEFQAVVAFWGLDSFKCENACGKYSTEGKPYSLKDKESKMSPLGNGHHTCDLTFTFEGGKEVKFHFEVTVDGCLPPGAKGIGFGKQF